MKIIFLDVDGVLINREACRAGFGKVDPECVRLVNKLTEETGAAIVLSSCWRMGLNAVECRELLSNWGITGEVLGPTPHDYDQIRGQEIATWLSDYQRSRDVESFVIIDDDADMGELLPRLVRTRFEAGFTAKDCARAIQLLSE